VRVDVEGGRRKGRVRFRSAGQGKSRSRGVKGNRRGAAASGWMVVRFGRIE